MGSLRRYRVGRMKWAGAGREEQQAQRQDGANPERAWGAREYKGASWATSVCQLFRPTESRTRLLQPKGPWE